ncbi:MAG: VRR-NUC domain-containing protein [Bacteroides sp.]|jgi:Holliday junction resolvase|nr:VRR-NUC domain-containing protein [Bacteroides sp.]MCI1681121.1 VRR-NUC domain-containing protein [Bacteroides sp.]
MAELESKIQAGIIKRLETQGYYVVKLILTNKNGIPDLLLLKDGKASFVEVKRPGEKPRPLQEYRMNELKKLGFKCEVWPRDQIAALTEKL